MEGGRGGGHLQEIDGSGMGREENGKGSERRLMEGVKLQNRGRRKKVR